MIRAAVKRGVDFSTPPRVDQLTQLDDPFVTAPLYDFPNIGRYGQPVSRAGGSQIRGQSVQ
jgi:hypothetical protein